MEEYIKKSAVVAEIERRIQVCKDYAKCNLTENTRIGNKAQQLELNYIHSFLDTLEVKEVQEESVSKDLEEAAFDYAEACKYDGGEKLLCVEHFKDGAKWQQLMSNTLPNIPLDLEKEIKLYKMRNPIIGHREESLNNYMLNVAKYFFGLGLKVNKGE